MIAESILLDIPFIGDGLNDLLFSISDDGMKRVYVNHIISFGLLWGWMVWAHVKKYSVSFEKNVALTIGILLFSVCIAAPFEPDHLGVTYISGPWFFLGLQELLRYLAPIVAGIFIPAILLLALFFLQKQNPFFRFWLYLILLWLLSYAALTMVALYR